MESREVIDSYLSKLMSTRGLSEATVTAYRQDLERFYRFLLEEAVEGFIIPITLVRVFIASLTREGLSVATCNRMLSAIKGFYRYLIKEGQVISNPFEEIRGFKKARRLPDVLSEKEIQEIIGMTGKDFQGIRDRLIFEMLYSTGCRVSELVGIDYKDVDLSRRTIMVLGKGGKDRLVFLGRGAMDALGVYLPLREHHVNKDDPDAMRCLIINVRGCRLTQRGITYIIDGYLEKSTLNKRVSPHTFRHTFATHILNHGADIRIVQEMLGHSSLSTTQIYTHMGTEKLRRVFEQAHPHGGRRRNS